MFIKFLGDVTPDMLVPTDGGRFDVNLSKRERYSVYWDSDPSIVRRCSWFFKGNADGKYVPYEEDIAIMLEEEYKKAFTTKTWNYQIPLPTGETVLLHGPDVLVFFPQMQAPDAWGNTPVTKATFLEMIIFTNKYILFSRSNHDPKWLKGELTNLKLTRENLQKSIICCF